ncbi:cell division and transport-associated protein TolQ [Paludibacterium purpuratum]|uniref:Tol-Pal system protein TolQ n=1 Tax=Paludibacterium purpuratum TaxID=1144873 RepID=A0A4R7B721_9NEIS|nr:protein TolQ [Paludibacterium purpuratum]TDR80544.1 cell division and transport-associated protein TolQ [Paludibacterium purpuratum]
MQPISFVSLILNASLVVQLVMAGLVLTSILSWALIFNKTFVLKSARRDSDEFERQFWSGTDLNRLYEDASRRQQRSGMERIFQSGFAEFLKLRGRNGTELSDIMDGARRAMRAAAQRELDTLDRHNAFLATVGSVSPYVGLFGTVWGIMHAFIGLGNAGQATLATVAPGIAEALVATAIGLFAAIPAVVAYNRFATDVDRLATRFDAYMEEFSNILQRLATR